MGGSSPCWRPLIRTSKGRETRLIVVHDDRAGWFGESPPFRIRQRCERACPERSRGESGARLCVEGQKNRSLGHSTGLTARGKSLLERNCDSAYRFRGRL